MKTSEWVQFDKRSKGDNAIAVDKQLRDVSFNELFINVEKEENKTEDTDSCDQPTSSDNETETIHQK